MLPSHDGVLQVEPTDHCNLSCGMCAPHHERWPQVHGVPKGHLDPVLWDRVAAGIAADEMRFDHLILQWLGEPLLHRDIGALVATSARRLGDRVGYLRIDTNGILLGASTAEGILAGIAGGPPLLVVLSIDAATEATYRRVKGRDALALVRRNVRGLLCRRRSSGARVNIQVQFVVQEGNAHEAAAFLAYWNDLLDCQGGAGWHDEILFKRLSVGGGAAGQAAADALYDRTTSAFPSGPHGAAHVVVSDRRPWQDDDAHRGARGPCPGPWVTPVVRHDGRLQVCCADLRGEMVLGSLAESGFRELWEGPAARAIREAQLARRFDGVCGGCGGINWYRLDDERIAVQRARIQ